MPFYALPYHIGVWKGMEGHKKGNGYKLEEGRSFHVLHYCLYTVQVFRVLGFALGRGNPKRRKMAFAPQRCQLGGSLPQAMIPTGRSRPASPQLGLHRFLPFSSFHVLSFSTCFSSPFLCCLFLQGPASLSPAR